MTFRVWHAALFGVTFTTSLAAQVTPEAAVDRYIQEVMEERYIPGLALAVMRDGKIVLAKGYGMANVEHNVPVKPETIFQSGSVGKQFTATLVMMLVEEGKLALRDPITKYFPEAPASWKPITIRHMLSHTSGLGDYPDSMDFRRDYTEDELLRMVYRTPLLFAPGEKWKYSNLAFLSLGVLIHRVTGQFYGDVLQARIFKPLGMTSTRIISESDLIPNRAAGYVIKNGELKNQEWVAPALNTTADGALYFNVLDLAKWDAALYTEKLVKRTSLEQMWTPIRLNDGTTYPYGFGWGVTEKNGRKIVAHGGSWQGFLTQITRNLTDRLTVVVLTNVSSKENSPGEIARQVAALYGAPLTP
ncbi:MAG: serine hydrolase domain-containing protein [Gemmatimonadota bacterium]